MSAQQKIEATKRHRECTTLRRVLTSHYQTSMEGGDRKMVRQEWSTKLCGSPLWSTDDVYGGTCAACKEGWKHPHNYPAGEKQPEECTDATHPKGETEYIRDPQAK